MNRKRRERRCTICKPGPDRIDVHVGRRPRQALRLAGRSHIALAAAVGVSFQAVQKYERGEGTPKTAAGVQTVPLSAEPVKRPKEWKMRSRFKKPDDLIFPNGQGYQIGHGNLLKWHFMLLFEALEAAHADDRASEPAPPRRFNWHGLRHYAVLCWIEAGLAPKTFQTLASHASLAVTMDRDGRLFPREDHKKATDGIAKGLLA